MLAVPVKHLKVVLARRCVRRIFLPLFLSDQKALSMHLSMPLAVRGYGLDHAILMAPGLSPIRVDIITISHSS